MFLCLPADNRLDPLGDAALVELLHVRVHLFKVLGESAVRVTPGYGTEFEHGFMGPWLRQTVIVHPCELVELLPRDHEGGQVGSVNGEEHHGEQRPHVRHESELNMGEFMSRDASRD